MLETLKETVQLVFSPFFCEVDASARTYPVPTPSGDITNTVTVKYKDALNTEKTDTASWTVDILHPHIDVSKSGPAYAHEGDTMTYTYTVTNTGDCPLSGVSMTDTLLGSLTGHLPDTTLNVGEVDTFTVNYVVPAHSTLISNTVTAPGSDPLSARAMQKAHENNKAKLLSIKVSMEQ
jgi:uncharacterized repeat protein (TIGR01451 family)